MAIDTLKVARRLREAGFSEPQAEAVVAAVQEGTEGADYATKADLAILRAEMREMEQRLISHLESEIGSVRTGIRSVRTEIGSAKASIEAAKSEIVFGTMQMILSAVLINIVGIIGARFAFAKMLGH